MSSTGDREVTRKDRVHGEGSKRWYERWQVWLVVLALLGGGFLAEPKARSRFNRWTEMRKTDRATVSFEKGDYAKAMLDARGALDANPRNIEANRIIAKSLEAMGSPAALGWRIRLEGLVPDDVENSVAVAKGALDAGDRERAERTIRNFKPQDKNTGVFQDILARLAMSRRDTAAAESHWEEACQLAPGNDGYRLGLASLRLKSKKPEVRATAAKDLKDISGRPAYALAALRTLLADALGRTESARFREFADSVAAGGQTTAGDFAERQRLRELYADHARIEGADTRDFADRLVAAPGSTFEDKISRLSALRAMQDPDFSAYLEELRKGALSSADHLFRLVTWMNNNNLPLLVAEWASALPVEIASKPPVCVAIADTYEKTFDWSKLRQFVEKASWGEIDYMRRAFLARSLERLEEPDKGRAQWKQAVASARSHPAGHARLDQLARLAQSWGWTERWEEVLWEMSSSGQCPRWVLDALWGIVLQAGETAKMQKVAGLIAKADPGGLTSRNNYTFLSLLLRTQEGDPHRAAKILYDENPSNPDVAMAYGLSLYQQGKAGKALAVMSALKPDDLRLPRPAFYHGLFLVAEGRTDEAAEFLQIGWNPSLLAEEKAILRSANEAAAKRTELQSRETAPSAGGGR